MDYSWAVVQIHGGAVDFEDPAYLALAGAVAMNPEEDHRRWNLGLIVSSLRARLPIDCIEWLDFPCDRDTLREFTALNILEPPVESLRHIRTPTRRATLLRVVDAPECAFSAAASRRSTP